MPRIKNPNRSSIVVPYLVAISGIATNDTRNRCLDQIRSLYPEYLFRLSLSGQGSGLHVFVPANIVGQLPNAFKTYALRIEAVTRSLDGHVLKSVGDRGLGLNIRPSTVTKYFPGSILADKFRYAGSHRPNVYSVIRISISGTAYVQPKVKKPVVKPVVRNAYDMLLEG